MHSNWFTTLTYDNDNVPFFCVEENKFAMSLCKMDVQRFMKRLRITLQRKVDKDEKITFFLCGEYGPQTLRPHYHLIVFNFPDSLDFQTTLQKLWIFGEVRRSTKLVNDQCHYATKYMIVDKFKPHERCTDPFKLMSNGLGKILADYDNNSLEVRVKFYNGNDPEEVCLRAMQIDWSKFHLSSSVDTIRDINTSFDWNSYDFVCRSCSDRIVISGHKFFIPRYIREKVYPLEVRKCLNLRSKLDVMKRQKEYHEQFYDYDLEMMDAGLSPMWLQLAHKKENELKKFYDKRYKNKSNKKLHS